MPGASSTLEIIIKLRDEATQAMAGFTSTLEKNRAAIQSVGIASGIAFAGIVAFAKSSVDAANESDLAIAQLNAVIKSTGDASGVSAKEMIDFAEAMQQQTTFSNEAVLGVEDLLLTFTAIGKDTMPQATQTVLDMSIALKEDTKDAAIQLGKALQDPILGVTALRRVGVNFNKDQQDLIKTMVESGHTFEAQQYILAELSREFGGSATAAAGTYAGKVQQLNNDWDDMQKQIGHALIPILLQLAEAILPIVQHVTEWIGAHPKLTAAIILVGGAITGLLTLLAAVALILPALTTAVTAFGMALMFLTLNPIGLTILALGAIVLAGVELYKHWDVVKEKLSQLGQWFENIWSSIKNTVGAAVDWLVSKIQPLINMINSVVSAAGSIASSVSSAGSLVMHSIPHFASGGIVTGPTLALIGEAGPEAVVPLGASSGGFGTNINITITGNKISSAMDMQTIARAVGDEIVRTLRLNQRLAI